MVLNPAESNLERKGAPPDFKQGSFCTSHRLPYLFQYLRTILYVFHLLKSVGSIGVTSCIASPGLHVCGIFNRIPLLATTSRKCLGQTDWSSHSLTLWTELGTRTRAQPEIITAPCAICKSKTQQILQSKKTWI